MERGLQVEVAKVLVVASAATEKQATAENREVICILAFASSKVWLEI